MLNTLERLRCKMTKDEALKMAINVLELYEEKLNSSIAIEVIQACKEALEQPTNMVTIPLDKLEDMQRRLKRKEWQGLNKYEIIAIDNATNDLMDFARAIEAKLKEKNHE